MIAILIIFLLGALTCASWFAYNYYKEEMTLFELRQLAIQNAPFLAVFLVLAFITAIKVTRPPLLWSILALLFVITGAIQAWFLFKDRDIAEIKHVHEEVFISGLTLFLGGFFFILISHFVSPLAETKYLYNSATLNFGVPILAYIAFVFWHRVPRLVPLGWTFREEYIPPNITIRPGDKVLNCVFNVANRDIRIKIPPFYKLGDAFHKVVIGARQRGKTIEVKRVDEKGSEQAVQWYFVTEGVGSSGRRYVDPNNTFQGNGIKDGDIIWAREAP